MSEVWPSHYILVDRTPIAVDLMTWVRWLEKAGHERVVGHTVIDATPTEVKIPFSERTYTRPRIAVSTVFLGLDHNYRISKSQKDAEPILFETMIFGGPLDGEMWRYSTYAQAERGHEEAVAQARIATAKVKALADAVGAKEK